MDCPVYCQTGVSLAAFTTYKIGGPADFLLQPRDDAEFAAAIRWCRMEGLPLTVLGGGSNVLIADAGIAGAVILTDQMRHLEAGPDGIDAGAGAVMDAVCLLAARHGLAGLENFYGMPGTLGGAIYMNARCYERAISEVLVHIRVVDGTGCPDQLAASDGGFAYKTSRFQGQPEWITSARLGLTPGAEPARLLERMEEFRLKRLSKGQYAFPNAGCVFKNDPRAGVVAGRVIEACGLKGFRVGEAEVFQQHANFVVNLGRATAEDVAAVLRHIQRVVRDRTGIQLEREVQLLGRWDPDSAF